MNTGPFDRYTLDWLRLAVRAADLRPRADSPADLLVRRLIATIDHLEKQLAEAKRLEPKS